MSMAIDMRGQPIGPFNIGRHENYGTPAWVWWDGETGFCCRSRWRWLCIWRHKRRLTWPVSLGSEAS